MDDLNMFTAITKINVEIYNILKQKAQCLIMYFLKGMVTGEEGKNRKEEVTG